MCTAATLVTKDHYFGRNLDLEYHYQEQVAVTPRNYPLTFRAMPALETHYAMIGMATVIDGYPLYYEATNEKGLSMAGLNFPDNATYYPKAGSKDNVTPFEFIPWILGQCKNIPEVRAKLDTINLWNEPFSPSLPLSTLHWIIADRDCAITVETMADGMKIYENPIGILANNPPFDYHMYHLADYMNLTSEPVTNRFSAKVTLDPYCSGMGGIGLPGDLSSGSRFVRAAFTKLNSRCGDSEEESISQFFHILGSVAQQRGCSRIRGQHYEITLYSSCCNTDKGIYYYTTYENSQISAVDMHRCDLDGRAVISYPLITQQQIRCQN